MSTFEKEYTRDFGLIMAQAWLYGLDRLCRESGWGSPGPTYIAFMRGGVTEYWGDAARVQWLCDRMYEENIKGESFFEKGIKLYQDSIRSLKPLWENGVSSAEELGAAITLIEDACVGWDVMYYSAGDERTPQDMRTRAAELRDADTLGDSSTAFLLESLRKLYPALGDSVGQILSGEVAFPPSEEELCSREKGFVILRGGDMDIAERMAFETFREQHPEFIFKEHAVSDPQQVRGSTGYRGTARGRVRMLLRRRQIPDLQEGEILVTHMTTPDFVPAMKKAAAFVTDEGGVTSHAAILARELEKPCVIGTKVATQVFKDGDMVEVDAEKGIVRKV